MAKKIKIDIDFSQDNVLVGISCHKKEYWLALQLNELMRIQLRRLNDLGIYKSRYGRHLYYPLFHFHDNDRMLNYYLFSNFNQEGKLFPVHKNMDYFLLINGQMGDEKLQEHIAKIRSHPGIIGVYILNFKEIKNYEDFLTDLELYMIDIIQTGK